MKFFKLLLKLALIGGGIFCVIYVTTRLEFEDPFQAPPILKGKTMSEVQRKAHPLQSVSMTPKATRMLYDAFGKLVEILEAHHIDYWACCGTLLGAVRHEGVIPYDDDVDIFVHEKDADRIFALKEQLKKVGLGIYQDRTSIMVYKLEGIPVRPKRRSFQLVPGVWFVRRKVEKFPFIDLYITKVEDGKYIHANPRARRVFPKEIFLESDIYPLKEYQFGPLRVKGPHNPLTHLISTYGPDWNKFLVFTSNHSASRSIKFKLPLTPDLAKYCFRYKG